MANLKEIRNRITSVSSTMQITSAMKMVSAAKLKKAQDELQRCVRMQKNLRSYYKTLSATLEGEVGGAFTAQREVKSTYRCNYFKQRFVWRLIQT